MYIKSVDEIIIGYVINEEFKILFVFKEGHKENKKLDCYNVFILREL